MDTIGRLINELQSALEKKLTHTQGGGGKQRNEHLPLLIGTMK
jgi:hypothetical protein